MSESRTVRFLPDSTSSQSAPEFSVKFTRKSLVSQRSKRKPGPCCLDSNNGTGKKTYWGKGLLLDKKIIHASDTLHSPVVTFIPTFCEINQQVTFIPTSDLLNKSQVKHVVSSSIMMMTNIYPLEDGVSPSPA